MECVTAAEEAEALFTAHHAFHTYRTIIIYFELLTHIKIGFRQITTYRLLFLYGFTK